MSLEAHLQVDCLCCLHLSKIHPSVKHEAQTLTNTGVSDGNQKIWVDQELVAAAAAANEAAALPTV